MKRRRKGERIKGNGQLEDSLLGRDLDAWSQSDLDLHQGSKEKSQGQRKITWEAHEEARACRVNFENDQKSIAPLRAQAVSTF
jgi:hypothetical protein